MSESIVRLARLAVENWGLPLGIHLDGRMRILATLQCYTPGSAYLHHVLAPWVPNRLIGLVDLAHVATALGVHA